MTNRTRLTVVIGPSGSGKSSHVERLLAVTDAELVRTNTTRPQRHEDENDTHIFISEDEFAERETTGYFVGTGSMGGYNYGLPHLPETDKQLIVMLRAPFVPTMKQYQPDAAVIQIEASVDTLIERLEKRNDTVRADAKRLEQEIILGRALASYVVSTDDTPDASFERFLAIWHDIHSH